jgi:glycosyltransferase involved in cell wall biosynthesis
MSREAAPCLGVSRRLAPLRVAFDARDLTAPAQRGMVRYLLGLVRHLPAYGIRVSLFHRKREPIRIVHLDGLNCDVIGLKDCSGVCWEQGSVPLALARGKFHLYHAAGERGVPFLAPCPVAFTLHSATQESYRDFVRRGLLPGPVSRYLGYDSDRNKWRWPSVYARLQRRCPDHTFTVSEFSRGELIRLLGLRPNRVSVVPLALPEVFERQVDPAIAAQARKKLAIHPPYLLNVGGFEPHKNVLGLLELLVAVRRRRPELSLVIVGTGRIPDSLLAAVAALKLIPGREILLLSDLGDELVGIYDGAEVFVSLSWRESFGVPALEAMARGVPVVASQWGAGPEVISGGGILVDPRNTEEAAAAVLRLLDPSTRAEFADRGREQVSRFSWERTAELTAAVYYSLSRGKSM